MLVECANCNAPLDTKGNDPVVKCAYCGRTNQLQSMRMLQQQTPPQWRPPPQWQPPPHVSPHALQISKNAAAATRMSGCITLFVTTVVVVATVIPVLATTGLWSRLPFMGWDGETPFECGGNDEVTIDGVTAKLPDDTAITVRANCTLHIIDSKITAYDGIDAGGNRRVLIENSTIVATRTGIIASGNKEIDVRKSTVKAGGVGIKADGNVDVRVTGGQVSGSPAVSTSSNAELDARASAKLINR